MANNARSPKSKLPSVLTGVAGEFFVAAELSRRGYIASITLRNTRGVDVLAANSSASKSVGIQVKSNQGLKKDWLLNKKAETYFADNLFYVFVNLKAEAGRPEFHIVPSRDVATYVRKSHANWLATLGSRGQQRKDTSMRHFVDPENKYLERWDLLGLGLDS